MKLEELEQGRMNKDAFNKFNNERSIYGVLEDMSLVSEAHRLLISLEMAPSKDKLDEFSVLMKGLQCDLPFISSKLQELEKNNNLKGYKNILEELIQNYQKILKDRHGEL